MATVGDFFCSILTFWPISDQYRTWVLDQAIHYWNSFSKKETEFIYASFYRSYKCSLTKSTIQFIYFSFHIYPSSNNSDYIPTTHTDTKNIIYRFILHWNILQNNKQRKTEAQNVLMSSYVLCLDLQQRNKSPLSKSKMVLLSPWNHLSLVMQVLRAELELSRAKMEEVNTLAQELMSTRGESCQAQVGPKVKQLNHRFDNVAQRIQSGMVRIFLILIQSDS